MPSYANLDAAETQYFDSELSRLVAKAIETSYAHLSFRRLFPINHEGHPADEHIIFQIYDAVGSAKIIAAYADDLPAADVSAREVSFPIRTVGTSFRYSVHEIWAAKKTGKPLEQRKVNACNRAVEEKLNDIAWNGDPTSGLLGFLKNPNVPISNVIDPGAGTEWVNKTPDQILADINTLFSAQDEVTNQVEQATVLMLPVKQWNYINNTRLSAESETSIMQYLIKNSAWLTGPESIQKVRELKGIGVGGTDVMYIYNPDPDKLEMHITLEIDFLEPQQVNLSFKVPVMARCGGMHIYYPMSVSRAEGI